MPGKFIFLITKKNQADYFQSTLRDSEIFFNYKKKNRWINFNLPPKILLLKKKVDAIVHWSLNNR